MKKFAEIKNYIITAVVSLLVSCLCIFFSTPRENGTSIIGGVKDYAYEVYRDRTELHYQGAKDALVDVVDAYIDSIAPGSGLNGIRLVEICDEYDFDIKFALAQGQLESHFGTEGVAAKTNMVWNVGAYDNKSAKQIIKDGNKNTAPSHPDESIEPYIKLLYAKYLVNGKTEKDMFINYADSTGRRYASNPNYERALLGIYERIGKYTDIDAKIQEFRKYKIITGK